MHIFSKYLTGMTFLDHFDAIFKDRRPEITGARKIFWVVSNPDK
jgi:hypothetical protein